MLTDTFERPLAADPAATTPHQATRVGGTTMTTMTSQYLLATQKSVDLPEMKGPPIGSPNRTDMPEVDLRVHLLYPEASACAIAVVHRHRRSL